MKNSYTAEYEQNNVFVALPKYKYIAYYKYYIFVSYYTILYMYNGYIIIDMINSWSCIYDKKITGDTESFRFDPQGAWQD